MFFRQNGLKSQMELSIQQLESDVQEKQVQGITAFFTKHWNEKLLQ